MSAMISQALTIRETEDPAIAIRRRVNDYLDGCRVGGQDLLVAVFEPQKDARTSGGIILPDGSREEYRWQGCTGLVLKLGPLAYRTEKTERWFCEDRVSESEEPKPLPPKVGEWVMFDVKTSHSFLLGKQPCRLVACQYLLMIVERPDMVA